MPSTKCTYQISQCDGQLSATDALCNIFAKFAQIEWNNVDNPAVDYPISFQTELMHPWNVRDVANC